MSGCNWYSSDNTGGDCGKPSNHIRLGHRLCDEHVLEFDEGVVRHSQTIRCGCLNNPITGHVAITGDGWRCYACGRTWEQPPRADFPQGPIVGKDWSNLYEDGWNMLLEAVERDAFPGDKP